MKYISKLRRYLILRQAATSTQETYVSSNIPSFNAHNECGNLLVFDYLPKSNDHIIFVNYEYLCLDLKEMHNISALLLP